MAAKKPTIIYPAPQPELASAIAALQAAADTVEHVKKTVAEWPAKIAQAETNLAEIERRLDRKETDRDLTRGDKSAIDAEIEQLSSEAAEQREVLSRLRSRIPHLNERGEEANEALESAKREQRSQLSTYFNACRDTIAGPLLECAANLASLTAQYRILVDAAGYRMNTDWFDRVCVPDIRHTSRDLLTVDETGAVAAAVAAMNPTLEPLREGQRLLAAPRFDPRPVAAMRG
ncbi:hypothetical protein [Paraburkholderia caledonica]|uniref:hypothetical protein n=1 Tax=Paraburkholderia caledonica TaxID=134536 RepID=UPI000487439F|nr:hypothetical protein [Paraburkholderia caledonica]